MTVELRASIKRGDGVVFAGKRFAGNAADSAAAEDAEQGGRVYEVFRGRESLTEPIDAGQVQLTFAHGAIDFSRLVEGQQIWKTDDPELAARLRKSFEGEKPKRCLPVDLRIANCRMVVAVRKGFDYEAAVRQGGRLRIATKYVHSTREHFAAKGVHVDLIHLYGSMELAPIVGLADAIVDLVSTGRTLKANDLVEVEQIMPVSARLIVNQAALKTKRAQLQPLIDALAKAVR